MKMNLPARAPTTRKFEGDDYIELVIARHPKTSWYWQHGMEMECQKVNAKGRHDGFLGMQKLQEISQAFNRPQPTTPQNQEDALGAKLYAWKKKKATQVPQSDEYEQYCAGDPYEVSEEHTVKIGDGEDDMKVPGGVLIGYWRDNTWRWPNLARLALDALSIPAMSAECERRFSSEAATISPQRMALSAESIEAAECSNQWIRTNIN